MVLDLHMALTLRNARRQPHPRRYPARGLAGSRHGRQGSVTVPSLNIAPGEVFPVRIDMQLVRPTQLAGGPLVQVDLDGVLFQDLSFFGPDRLNSRRYLTACELEAQRDREHFKRILARRGKEGLRKEMIDSLPRQSELQPLTVKVRRGGRSSPAQRWLPSTSAEFAFVQFPDSPVEPVKGWAQISGNEARAPRIEVRNKSGQAREVCGDRLDRQRSGRPPVHGRLAAVLRARALSAARTDARVLQESTLNFSSNGQPVNVRQMTGFVNQVEFADGKVWVPNRQNLDNPLLQKAVAPSAEEQRLSEPLSPQGHRSADRRAEEVLKLRKSPAIHWRCR